MNHKESIWLRNKRKIAASFAGAASILAVTVFTAAGGKAGFSALLPAVLISACAGALPLLRLQIGKRGTAALYLAVPVAALWALENYTHTIQDLKVPILILNLLFFYLLYGFCAVLLGSVRLGFAVATLIPMLFGLVNYFVVSFRGSPVVPWDLLSLGTAVSVADNYSFVLSWKAAYSVIIFICLIVLSSLSSVRFSRWKLRLGTALAYAFLLFFYITGIQKDKVQSFFGMDKTLFTLNVMYRNNGITAAFLGNLRFLKIEEPDGYSREKAETLLSEASATYDAKAEDGAVQRAEPEEYPNIVVIMDEAFSDLSVWGDFETSEEVMPFFKSLQKEAVSGEVYVSVKGGNTANTEFEFLTGHTMGFLPAGSVPYQQYIHGDTPSLASWLGALGYETTAIHPYNRSGWDRDEVYDYFGFDEFLDKDSFYNPYRLRGYISDKSAFDKIVEQLQLKPEGSRCFLFEVTMQNHGGYSKDSPGFPIYLTLPQVTKKTTSVVAAEKYLTLINQTDRAFSELIEWLSGQEEPVVVLMFGDHQPSDYITNVIQRACGAQPQEGSETGYRVPFLIWSNRGLEPEYYEGISVNYLSALLLEKVGLPLTDYQKFLSGLMEQVPVVTGQMFRTADGEFHRYGEEDGLLDAYRILQYDLMRQ